VVSGASDLSEGGARREREIAAAKGQPAEEGFEAALAADMDTLAAHRSGQPRACQRVATRVPSLLRVETRVPSLLRVATRVPSLLRGSRTRE
jgi:hypothetical protein